MTRKFFSVLVTAALAFSLFPLATANAAATGTARLTQGTNTLPGSARPYSIVVTTDNAPVNYVNIILPQSAGLSVNPATPIAAPEGWTARPMNAGVVQQVTFTGGPLRPDDDDGVEFTFPAEVAAPVDRDKSGKFRVELSSDGGLTSMQASEPVTSGTLTTTTRVLHVEQTSMLSPAGVLDLTGTEKQQGVRIRTTVRNYALSALQVTPGLTPTGTFANTSDEKVTASSPAKQILSGGTATFDHTVTLGTASINRGTQRGDRAVDFEGRATAPNASAISSLVDDFVVQIAPSVSLPSTANVSPRTVRPGQAVQIQVPLRKSGTPGLTITSGSLTFGSTTCPLASVGSFGGGGSQDATLAFNCTVQSLTGEQSFPASMQISGLDANDAAFSASYDPLKDSRTPSNTLNITIDGLAPDIDLDVQLPRDADGQQQTAVKKGDTVRVIGRLDDSRATINLVELRTDSGQTVEVPVERIPDPQNVDGNRFVGQATIPFDRALDNARARGVAVDPAGNLGEGYSTRFIVDNIKPLMNFGMTMSTTDIEEIAYNANYEPTAIKIGFSELERLRGGCNPASYKVDGAQAVVAVLYPSGDLCEPGRMDPNESNDRVLLLGVPIGRNDTPSVTYTPVPGDQAKDGAGNVADRRTVDTIAGIAPAVPDLIDVWRNTGSRTSCDASSCERAYEDPDSGAYYTRFSGSDLLVTVGRAAPGYTLQVLDGAGLVITSKSLTADTGTIRVPIGSLDTTYARKLRFLSPRGIPGAALDLDVVLDRVAPSLQSSGLTVTDAGPTDRVTVPFSEKVVQGLDASQNWKLFDDNQGYLEAYSPDRADQEPDTSDPRRMRKDTRVLTGETGRYGEFVGAGYVFNPAVSNNVRYADRAGNTLANTNGPAAKVGML